jgi:hypothetical protein
MRPTQRLTRLVFMLPALFLAVMGFQALAGSPAWSEITVYKSPTCGCCSKWVDHLRDNGFEVKTVDLSDMRRIKSMSGVKPEHASCHTAKVDGYVIEGHVPASDIKRLLKERPAVTGLSAPGMPMGSPGMEGPRSDPYEVITFDKQGRTSVFSRHNQD